MSHTFREAVRALRSSRGTTALAVLCLSVGIGVNTAVFSLVNGLLLRPLPFADPDRLVILSEVRRENPGDTVRVSYPNFRDWQEQSAIGELAALRVRPMTVSVGGVSQRHPAAYVSWNLLSMLGVQPALGRALRADDDRPGAAPVVVLSDALWQQRFAANPRLIGQSVQIDRRPHTVVGIMPPQFTFPRNQRLWLPLTPAEGTSPRTHRILAVYARLAPTVGLEQARARLALTATAMAEQYPNENRGWEVGVRRLSAFVPARQRAMLFVMMGAVACVLLIACGNVANLMLARGISRQRHIAIRTALGASRGRILGQLLTESLLVAGMSIPLGMLLASWGLSRLQLAIPDHAALYGISIAMDARVLAFTISMAVLTSLLFGLAPSLQAIRGSMKTALSSGGRESSAGVRQKSLSSTLVIGEVALSVILLVGATLFVRSFMNLLRADSGFDTAPLLTLGIELPAARQASPDETARTIDEIVHRLEALPGVQFATASDVLPLRGGGTRGAIEVEGHQAQPRRTDTAPQILHGGVTAHFFQTLGVPLTRGRSFTTLESRTRSAVAVVNRTMAERIWPGADPIGKRFRLRDDASQTWFSVVGVTRDVANWDVSSRPVPSAYLPYVYASAPDPDLLIRATGEPLRLAGLVRETLRDADPMMPVSTIQPMTDVHRLVFWRNRLLAGIFLSFGAIAIVLAAVGLHGVLSYSVSQRRREIGVRMALGARQRDVVQLIVKQGMMLVLIGMTVGLVGAFATTRLVRGQLYELSATDPMSFASVVLLLAVIGFLSSYGPARRAAAVDPLRTLQE